MHFKPRWLAYTVATMVGLIALKNVLGWDGDLAAVLGALAVALGMGLQHIFGTPETSSPPAP